MADDSSRTNELSDGARMPLEPDAIHETDDGYAIDCPECGAAVSLIEVVETGRCPGYLDADAAETAEAQDEPTELKGSGCTAKLSLELVWES